jgi:phosphoribosylglycinamide formyltransferase-1
MNVGVLASGEGTNLQALIDELHGREVTIVGVASDKPQAKALQRAHDAQIPTAVFELGDYPDRAARDAAIAAWLDEQGVALLVLAGYMALLTPPFIAHFAGRIINVHPSLLPKYPGLNAIGQAFDAGETTFGVTIHQVDEGIDSGPVIAQESIEIEAPASPEAVHRALQPLEHRRLTSAVREIAAARQSR